MSALQPARQRIIPRPQPRPVLPPGEAAVLHAVDGTTIPIEKNKNGGCRLLSFPNRSHPSFPIPQNINLGTIFVDGLSVPIAMKPNRSNYYISSDPLPYPGFDEGADITARTDGGDVEPMTLRGWGTAPLVVTSSQSITVDWDTPCEVTWIPPSEQVPSRVLIELQVKLTSGDHARRTDDRTQPSRHRPPRLPCSCAACDSPREEATVCCRGSF